MYGELLQRLNDPPLDSAEDIRASHSSSIYHLKKSLSESLGNTHSLHVYMSLLIQRICSYYNLSTSSSVSQGKTIQRINLLVKHNKDLKVESAPECFLNLILRFFTLENAETMKIWIKERKLNILLDNEDTQFVKYFIEVVELWRLAFLKDDNMESLRRHLLKQENLCMKADCKEEANWYFESACSINLDATRQDWINTLKTWGGGTDVTNHRFEYGPQEQEKCCVSSVVFSQIYATGVSNIRVEGGFFQLKYINPETYSSTLASTSLCNILFGYTTTPFSIIAKLDSQYVLVSRGVDGIRLKDYKPEDIDTNLFGIHFLRTLLTMPGDDKLDHLYVQHSRDMFNNRTTSIFCVCIFLSTVFVTLCRWKIVIISSFRQKEEIKADSFSVPSFFACQT